MNLTKIEFAKPAYEVAKLLLGKVIHYNKKRYIISETESYSRDEDLFFCYGSLNKEVDKKLKSAMFYSVGQWCPWGGMLMISCNSKNYPDNVLIRSAIDLDDFSKCFGPCNLGESLKINEPNIVEKTTYKDSDYLNNINGLDLESCGISIKESISKIRVGLVKHKYDIEDYEEKYIKEIDDYRKLYNIKITGKDIEAIREKKYNFSIKTIFVNGLPLWEVMREN